MSRRNDRGYSSDMDGGGSRGGRGGPMRGRGGRGRGGPGRPNDNRYNAGGTTDDYAERRGKISGSVRGRANGRPSRGTPRPSRGGGGDNK